MTLDIMLRDVVLSDEHRSLIEKKVEKNLSRFPKPLSVKLTLHNNKNGSIEARLQLFLMGNELIGVAKGRNSLVAFDEALSKVNRQFNKRFDKINTRKRRDAANTKYVE